MNGQTESHTLGREHEAGGASDGRRDTPAAHDDGVECAPQIHVDAAPATLHDAAWAWINA